MSEIVSKKVLELRKVFNHQRYEELLQEPPKTLENYKGDTFKVDADVFRKFCQYAHNMLFKNLDVWGLFGGGEGSGKSTDASQVAKQFHYILVETNILNHELGTFYEFTEENILCHNFKSYLYKKDKFADWIFRIYICDEAGGLKSEERWDEDNKLFRDDMRKNRKRLEINLLCFPQPFELVKDFAQGRVNFLRLSKFRQHKTKGLIPDKVDTIIIPRGEYTFSWNTREKVHRKEIKRAISDQTKERYTKDFPKNCIYKTTTKDITFCFDAHKYDKQAKEENRMFKKTAKVLLTSGEVTILANNLTAGKLGFSVNKKYPENATIEEIKELDKDKRDGYIINKLAKKCVSAVKQNS